MICRLQLYRDNLRPPDGGRYILDQGTRRKASSARRDKVWRATKILSLHRLGSHAFVPELMPAKSGGGIILTLIALVLLSPGYTTY